MYQTMLCLIDLYKGGGTMSDRSKKSEQLIDRLNLPADALGTPTLTVSGRRRLLVENHGGILCYGDSLIEINCRNMKIRVRGDDLRLGAMDKKDMLICGRILSVELE